MAAKHDSSMNSMDSLLNKIVTYIRDRETFDLREFDVLIDSLSVEFSENKKADTIDIPKSEIDLCKNMYDYRASIDPSKINYDAEICIKNLGKPPALQGEQPSEMLARLAREMSYVLTSKPEGAISMKVESNTDEHGNMYSDFTVSAENISNDALCGMIRGIYNRTNIRPKHKSAEKYQYSYSAQAKLIVRDKKILSENRQPPVNSWITNVLQSVVQDPCYTAEVTYIPLYEERYIDDLEKHLQYLRKAYKVLSLYSDISWNDGINGSENFGTISSNFLKQKFEDLVHAFTGQSQMSASLGKSYAVTTKEINKEYQCLMEDLDYEITRLQRALNSHAWAVSVRVSANDESTLNTVASVLAGTFEANNFSLEWTDNNEHFIASDTDIQPLMYFPTKDFAGFAYIENETFSLVSPCENENRLELGNILWNETPISTFALDENVLNRHAFICGMTGAGKTNTLFKMIESNNVPFMVIEPVKGEYRSLCNVYSDTHVWSMRTSDAVGENLDILRMNPLWFPPEANISFHIDSIKTIIASAFELYNAMPNILEQCLYNVYLKAGWNFVTNTNMYSEQLAEEYLYPTFEDLTNEVADYLERSDFGEELKGDYKGALLSRLKSFTSGAKGILLNTSTHPNYEKMISGRNIIELEGLADDSDKCLVMGVLLVQYYEYLKHHFTDAGAKNKLKHLIVIEEAHRLFKNTSKKDKSQGADPTGQLVESLSNIMAEIRAFGEGVLIVDQSPTKVAPDVIKNSATKIIHRIDNGEDIKILQSAMLVGENMECFAALGQGEALIRSDGMRKACKVKIALSENKELYSLSSSFSTNNVCDGDILDSFAATTIFRNTKCAEAMEKQIPLLLNSICVGNEMDWQKNWYDIADRFLVNLYLAVQKANLAQHLNFRLNGLIKAVLLHVKAMYSDKDRLHVGKLLMFLDRYFDMYRDKRNGIKVKQKSVDLLFGYLKNNIPFDILQDESDRIGDEYVDDYICDTLDIHIDQMIFVPISDFIADLVPLLQEERDAYTLTRETLLKTFFDKKTYLNYEEFEERYSLLFENMANMLNDSNSVIFNTMTEA